MVLMSQSVSFGRSEGGPGISGTLGAVKDSFLNVGLTAVVGGTVGGAAGKLAALTPYKPTVAQMQFQYADMFEKAIIRKDIPDFIKNAGGDFVQLTEIGKQTAEYASQLATEAAETKILYGAVQEASDEIISGSEFKTKITEFFKGKETKIADADYTKEGLLSKLKEHFDKIREQSELKGKLFNSVNEDFVKKAENLGDCDMKTLAEKGAKHLRKRSIIGAGIAIGIIGALTLNILKTYGVIGRRRPVQNQGAAQAQNPSGTAPVPKMTTQG